MAEEIKYRLYEKQDLNKIRDLLHQADLPTSDIEEGKIKFIIAVNEKNELVGCIGIEQWDADGLLRSMVVAPDYRGKRIGHELLYRLLSISRQLDINTLHLLTTTAEKFFGHAGFSLVERNNAPASIKATSEFSSLCPSTSAYMVMRNIQRGEFYFGKDAHIIKSDKENGSHYWAIKGENVMLTHFDVAPGTVFAPHSHGSEQITHVLEGELCFEIENKIYCLTSGDTIIIPPKKLHKAWTGAQSAKAIDAWSPVGQKHNGL